MGKLIAVGIIGHGYNDKKTGAYIKKDYANGDPIDVDTFQKKDLDELIARGAVVDVDEAVKKAAEASAKAREKAKADYDAAVALAQKMEKEAIPAGAVLETTSSGKAK